MIYNQFRSRIAGALRGPQTSTVRPVPPNYMPQGHEPNPPDADTLTSFRFFAVLKTWMEEDVVEATVRNAFEQGVERVFLVDNASTDETVNRAEAAGAVTAEVYDYEIFNDRLVQTLVNAVVIRESLRCREDHIWWLYLDADEFPEGPQGLSIREYLATLDRRFRIVGATFINHFPDKKPEYASGFHPLDFQPLCYQVVPTGNRSCAQLHYKHPLQRFDRQASFIQCDTGAHDALGGDKGARLEPTGGIITHHFQYRAEEVTRARLEMLCGPESQRSDWYRSINIRVFDKRFRSVDAVYERRWNDIEIEADHGTFANPIPWPETPPVRRWYNLEDIS